MLLAFRRDAMELEPVTKPVAARFSQSNAGFMACCMRENTGCFPNALPEFFLTLMMTAVVCEILLSATLHINEINKQKIKYIRSYWFGDTLGKVSNLYLRWAVTHIHVTTLKCRIYPMCVIFYKVFH